MSLQRAQLAVQMLWPELALLLCSGFAVEAALLLATLQLLPVSAHRACTASLQDVLVVTAPGSGAEVIPFLKTYVNLPMAIGFTVIYSQVGAGGIQAATPALSFCHPLHAVPALLSLLQLALQCAPHSCCPCCS